MMKAPQYVLSPKFNPKEAFAKGQEIYISIDEVEPGSELAQAVVRTEKEYGSPRARLRAIATHLQVELK